MGVETKSHNRTILSVVDRFSKYVFLRPMPDSTATTVASKLLEVFSFTALPKVLVSDNQSSFLAKVVQRLWNLLKIKHITVSTYMSRENSTCERRHRIYGDMLRSLLNGNNFLEWDTMVPLCELYARGTPTVSYKISPYKIVHGFEPRLWTDDPEDNHVRGEDTSEYVEIVRAELKKIHEIHRKILEENDSKVKTRYDSKVKPYQYQVGDIVLRKYESSLQEGSIKFRRNYYEDKFEIIELVGQHHARIRNMRNGRTERKEVHLDKLHPLIHLNPPRDTKQFENADENQENERIIDDRVINGEQYYLVQGANNTSWENKNNVLEEQIENYRRNCSKNRRRKDKEMIKSN